MRTNIIFEDEHILVIQKPAGLAVQTARIGAPDVESELKNYLAAKGQPPYLGIVHRLDQPVEGVLVFAKSRQAAAALTSQLQQTDFLKEYLAVVGGKPDQESGRLVDYLIKEGGKARVAEQNGKRAVLQYEVLSVRTMEAQQLSLLKIQLETGRFHQIRAQLSHAGLPILGDGKYGTVQSKALALKLGIRSTALCAERLTFLHPVTKKKMEYTVSPLNAAFAIFKE